MTKKKQAILKLREKLRGNDVSESIADHIEALIDAKIEEALEVHRLRPGGE